MVLYFIRADSLTKYLVAGAHIPCWSHFGTLYLALYNGRHRVNGRRGTRFEHIRCPETSAIEAIVRSKCHPKVLAIRSHCKVVIFLQNAQRKVKCLKVIIYKFGLYQLPFRRTRRICGLCC